MSEQQDRELKNAIFAAKEAAERAQMVSQQEAAKKHLGIEMPTGFVPLPSRGLVYPTDSPIHLKEELEIYGMTAMQEDILMNRTYIKKGTVITELIKSCLADKGIDVNDLISGDRNALMVAIRITGYGQEYAPQMQCPQCELKQEFSIDLSNLNIKTLQKEPVEPGTNKFDFLLPMSRKKVIFKFLTGREEEEILATMEAKKKRGLQNDNVITTRLLYSIVSIDGETDRQKISTFIKFMPAGDSLALRKYIDALEPTIDMKAEFACNSCDYTEVVAIPMGPSFFWPDTRG